VCKAEDRTPCVVICNTCPSWIFVLTESKLEPRVVVLMDPSHLELTRKVVREDCKILVGSLTMTSFYASAIRDVCLGLIDGGVSTELITTLEGLGLETVYYTKRLRQKIPGWNNANSPIIQHAAVGGGGCRW
jgi:hypothetical protein